MRHHFPHRSIPRSSDDTKPLPIELTVTSTDKHLAYSLNGPLELIHRSAQVSTLGDDALLYATVKALEFISPNRVTRLLKIHRKHQASVIADSSDEPVPPDEQEDTLEAKMNFLPVQIRTSSQELIEAGNILQSLSFDAVPLGLPQALWVQLKRFEIQWQSLPLDSAEVSALQRWCDMCCVPGRAMYEDGPTRSDVHASLRTHENVDGPDPVPNEHYVFLDELAQAA